MKKNPSTPPPMEANNSVDCLRQSGIAKLINAFMEPAYLVSPAGNVIFANRAAREAYDTPPHWVSAVGKSPRSMSFDQLCVRYELDLQETSLQLVLPLPKRNLERFEANESRILASLPPSLSQVAQLLMMGMSDKEIARCTELTVASVRTYTSRIYRRLKIRGRQELLALALAEKADKS